MIHSKSVWEKNIWKKFTKFISNSKLFKQPNKKQNIKGIWIYNYKAKEIICEKKQ